MTKKELRAMAILVGTTIGAGIFGIPYAVAQVGFGVGLIYLLVLGGVVLLLNLLYGEVILRTPGDHQLTGYGQIYWGKWGQALAALALFIGLYGALLAYLIKIGEFLALIFNLPYPLMFSLIFFLLAAAALFFGLKAVSQIELLLVGLILIFIAVLTLIGLPSISFTNYQLSRFHRGSSTLSGLITNYSSLFLPYGVILFALAGSSAVPEMEEVLRQKHKSLKKAIIIGSLIPLLTYLIFAWIVVGVSGQKTSDDAISGLAMSLPQWITILGASLGILAMGTSFLALGYVLREVWHRDFKFPKTIALGLACLPPLILFLLGAKNFIAVLEITGALIGGLTGVLIILLYRKARLASAEASAQSRQARKTGEKQPASAQKLELRRGEPAYQLNIPTAILWLLGLIFLLGMFSPWF